MGKFGLMVRCAICRVALGLVTDKAAILRSAVSGVVVVVLPPTHHLPAGVMH